MPIIAGIVIVLFIMWAVGLFPEFNMKETNTPYTFRSLPCSIGDYQMPWTVVGKYETDEDIGGGILEWCYSEQDAENLASKMKLDPRFKNVKVEEYKE